MTDKERILIKVTRRIDEIMKMGDAGVTRLQELETLTYLQTYIDSLPEDPVSDDLVKFSSDVAFEMLPATANKSYHYSNRNRISDGVIRGARWQKQQTLDKACAYLNEHREGFITDDYIKDFRKALEED